MKSITALIVFTFLAFVSAAEVAAAITEPVSDLMKRQHQCAASRCYCNRVFGPFCGNEAINPYCINSHVYQCFEDGTTCDYGPRQSCLKCRLLHCPGYE